MRKWSSGLQLKKFHWRQYHLLEVWKDMRMRKYEWEIAKHIRALQFGKSTNKQINKKTNKPFLFVCVLLHSSLDITYWPRAVIDTEQLGWFFNALLILTVQLTYLHFLLLLTSQIPTLFLIQVPNLAFAILLRHPQPNLANLKTNLAAQLTHIAELNKHSGSE